MQAAARWRRNARLVVRELRPGAFGLFNPERAGALFVDGFALALLEAVGTLGSRTDALRLLPESATTCPDVERAAGMRLDALERFGALLPEPALDPAPVLLIDPPCPPAMCGTPGPSKGLCYLASALEAQGAPRARILDLRSASATVGPERAAQAAHFARHVAHLHPRVIGLTAVSATIESACFIARLARATFPEACLVLGGPHASYAWQALLREEPALDVIVRGEGELSFPPLVREVCAAAGRAWCCQHLVGLAWRGTDGVPVTSGWSPWVEDLDALGIPRDREYVLNADEFEWPSARILTARGCTFQCSFCSTASFTGRRVRARGVQGVIDEIGARVAEGIRHFTFDDDIFTVNRKRTLALCDALRASAFGARITWGCNTRLDCVDERLIDALAAAGCRHVLFGVESGDAEIQGRFGKGRRSLHRFREKIVYLAQAGLEAQLNFILGLPGETRATLSALVDLIDGLPPQVTYAFNFLSVFPGTPLAENLDRLGLRPLGDTPRERYSITAPTVATPTLDADDQIDAYLRLRYFTATGCDTLRPTAHLTAGAA